MFLPMSEEEASVKKCGGLFRVSGANADSQTGRKEEGTEAGEALISSARGSKEALRVCSSKFIRMISS